MRFASSSENAARSNSEADTLIIAAAKAAARGPIYRRPVIEMTTNRPHIPSDIHHVKQQRNKIHRSRQSLLAPTAIHPRSLTAVRPLKAFPQTSQRVPPFGEAVSRGCSDEGQEDSEGSLQKSDNILMNNNFYANFRNPSQRHCPSFGRSSPESRLGPPRKTPAPPRKRRTRPRGGRVLQGSGAGQISAC